MDYYFTSACNEPALFRTHDVLDNWADRIDVRAWRARLSSHALDKLHCALREAHAQSDGAAIACHTILPDGTRTLQWIIGSRRAFMVERGHSCVKLNQLMTWLVQAAGLTHDIGKSNSAFQMRLRLSNAEAIALGKDFRHEVISAAWLAEALANHAGDLTPQAWNTAAAALKAMPDRWPIAAVDSVEQLLLWLVSTHHSLPVAYEDKTRSFVPGVLYRCGAEIHAFNFTAGHAEHCGGLAEVLPAWQHLYAAIPDFAGDTPALASLAVLSRLAFKLVDFDVSATSSLGRSADPAAVLANREQGVTPVAGQRLEQHLLEECRLAPATVSRVLGFSALAKGSPAACELPALYPEERHAIDCPAPVAFDWQNAAEEEVHKHRPEGGYQGFFGVVAAGTGAGKTRGSARLMSALAGDEGLRYSVLLGLRSLTLQTGAEYRTALGLKPHELATLIGCRATRELHQGYPDETEVILHEWVAAGDSEEGSAAMVLPAELNELIRLMDLSADQRVLLSAPVLVCTADYLAGAANLAPRKSWIVPLLRLLASDLVLDEADNYDGCDLTALARLVWLAGALGRRVLISSATISPLLAKTLFQAYQAGWQGFAALKALDSRPPVLYAGVFSNASGFAMNQVFAPASAEAFDAAYQDHCRRTIDYLGAQPARRKMALLTGLGDSIEVAYRVIAGAIPQLHAAHAIDAGEGRRLSVGLVRTARVLDCIRLAKVIAETDYGEDAVVKVVAYHARHLLGMRNFIERELDGMLKRSSTAGRDPILAHPRIARLMAETTAKDVIIVVVATPVEEVGRDHDADWSIADPSSWRSIVQLAGRVRRHRSYEARVPNLLVLERSLAAIKGSHLAYSRPGYQTTRDQLASVWLKDLMDLPGGELAVHAQPVLDTAYPGRFAEIEREALREVGCNAAPLAAGAAIWHDGHAHKFPFRRQDQEQYTVWLHNRGKLAKWGLHAAKNTTASIPVKLELDLPAAARLFPETLEEVVQATAEHVGREVDAAMLERFFFADLPVYEGRLPVQWFAPHVGFCPAEK